MFVLITLICCSVLIAVVFKLFVKFRVDNLEAIVSNYFTCAVLAQSFAHEIFIGPQLFSMAYFPYALIIGLMFIAMFNITAISVQKVGMIVTGVFQKMSLIIPALFGILLFNESCPNTKTIGIFLALSSIVLMNSNLKNSNEIIDKRFIYLPLLIWITSGITECIFYYVNRLGIINDSNLEFTGTLFLIAGIVGLPFIIYRRKGNVLKNTVAGIALGIPNFFSIYLLLELLDQSWDASTLFPILNVAILALTGIIGFFLFSERLTSLKIIGLLFAAGSIYLLSK